MIFQKVDFGEDRVCLCGFGTCDLCWPDGICRVRRDTWGRSCEGCERCQSVNWLRKRVTVRAIGGTVKLLQSIRRDDQRTLTEDFDAGAIVNFPLVHELTYGDFGSAIERLYEAYKRELQELQFLCRHKYTQTHPNTPFDLRRFCSVCIAAHNWTFQYTYDNRISGWERNKTPLAQGRVEPDRSGSPPPYDNHAGRLVPEP